MTSLFLPQNTQFNMASLIGQYSLKRTESALATNIRNLSTGLQLHSGRDDPSAFVSSSILGSEIAYMGHAVSNCKTADGLCAVADSALAQINNILLDIRSLVTEAANTGAMNTEMLEAMQLQVDASLDTIDRIASSTQFIDQKLLDGSLDFVTYGLDDSKVDFLQVNQANFMGKIEQDIAVKILHQAKQATLYYRQVGITESVNLSVGGKDGYTTIPVAQGADFNSIVEAVNLVSDSTGVEARLETRATNGQIFISSVGENNDILLTASEAGTLGGNFVVKYTAPREGNDTLKLNYTPGQGNDPNCIEVVLQTKPSVGNQAPEVLTTAEQVVELINTSKELQDENGNGRVVASLPDCTSGTGIVTPFEDYAYCGSVEAGNALQFLGLANSPNITFVSEPGQHLSVGYTEAPTYAKAEAVVQGLDAGTSFSLQTRQSTGDYDGYAIKFVDSTTESVELDETNGTVIFNIDFSGRKTDPNREPINIKELQTMFEASEAAEVFYFTPQQTYDPNNPPQFADDNYLGINETMATVSGGLVDPGTLTVYLETDQGGVIKTTANDLVDYFNYPASDEEIKLLQQLGISVSNICESTGNGLLSPTYDPDKCEEPIGCPTIRFGSSGLDVMIGHPNGTVEAKNGIDASFVVTAKQTGASYNNTTVRVATDPNGLSVSYNANSKSLTIGIDPNNPPTADEVIALINSDDSTKDLFEASRAVLSTGQGKVAVGDRTSLTGGVSDVNQLPTTTVTSSGGVNAVFNVSAKQLDSGLDGCSVLVINDANGPSVSYDAASNQLAIGINPTNPSTAQEIIDLINGDEQLSKIFVASLPQNVPGSLNPPNGTGFLQLGDGGVMRVEPSNNASGAPMLCACDDAAVGIVFYSTDYGSDAFVDVQAKLPDQYFPVVDRFGIVTERAIGVDISATINGQLAVGSGNVASMNTTELDMSIWINPDVRDGDVTGFRITGGGALMQLGPDVDPNQQVRIAFQSVYTTNIGGPSGYLSQLRYGSDKDLLTDTKGAYRIVEESILQISTFRGRIGSFQKYEVGRNLDQLSDMIEVASTMNSEIRDTDYAVETSNLAKNQLMLEAITSVIKKPTDNMRLLTQLLNG